MTAIDYDKPLRLLMIDDTDVSDDMVSSSITLRENAVSDCLLVANNEAGKSYLHTLSMGSSVTVSHWYKNGSPYEVFVGKIVELDPATSMSGELVTVRAYGKAYCLKNMRVACEYGSESKNALIDLIPVTSSKDCNGYSYDEDLTNPWYHYGSSPYLDVTPDANYIAVNAISTDLGKKDGNWAFADLSTTQTNLVINSLVLYVTAVMVEGTGGHPTSVAFTPYILVGDTWVECAALVMDDATAYQFSGTLTTLTEYQVDITDAIGDMKTIEDFNNLKIRLEFVAIGDGGSNKGLIVVDKLGLYIDAVAYNEVDTLKAILTNADIGIIPQYVQKCLKGMSSGYSVNTSYVYDDPLVFKYLYFPYQSAFDCLTSMMNLLSAMRYGNGTSPLPGPHWIMTNDGKLLIAPIGAHQVNGISSDDWADRVATTLEVKKTNIVENFTDSEPLANFVIVAGRFEFPTGDVWCEPNAVWVSEDAQPTFSTDAKVGNVSVRMGRTGSYAGQNWWLDNMNGIILGDIATKNNPVNIELYVKKHVLDSIASQLEIRLYTGPVVNGDYFVKGMWNLVDADDEWIYVTFELGDKGGWDSVGSPDWDEISHIGFQTTFGGTAYSPYILIDGISLTGAIIRVAYDSDSITQYGCKMMVIRDSLAINVGFESGDDSSQLAQVAKFTLLKTRSDSTTAKISIPLDPTIKAGQLVHIHALPTDDLDNYATGFMIDRDFRITEVVHSYSTSGAISTLTLTDDLLNAIPLNPSDALNDIIRAVSPDAQDKTLASVKATNELDPELVMIMTDYAP